MTIRDPWIKALVIIMLLIAAVYLIGLLWQAATQFADLILLFFLAWVISFILDPVVALLTGRLRLPRTAAVGATYTGVLVGLSLAIVQLVPRLSRQVVEFLNELPLYVKWINDELLRLQSLLAGQGIIVAPETVLNYQEVVRQIENHVPAFVANTVGVATGVANLLFQTFIVVILSFYLTLDGRRIAAAILLALPAGYREDAGYFLERVNRAFAGFIRGQLAQAAIYGFGTAVVMSLAGLDLVLLPSLASCLLMLIPFLGPILAIAIPLLITAVTRPEAFWAVLIALFVLQQVVVNVIAPRLMSHTVGLHPLLVFLAVLGGAKLAGVWGALFGVPVLAVATAMASFYYRARVEGRQDAGWPAAPSAGQPAARSSYPPGSADRTAPSPSGRPDAFNGGLPGVPGSNLAPRKEAQES